MSKDIIKRWNERVVANGWEAQGNLGAEEYLKKYGKNISNDKIKAIADYATSQGFTDFANGLMNHICEWKEFTLDQAEALGALFCDDALVEYNDSTINGVTATLFESTIRELAKRNVGTACGEIGNTCYKNIATKHPDVLVRGTLIYDPQDNIYYTGSVLMKVANQTIADEISDLADAGDGSLRNDFAGTSWTYFETE